MQPPSRGWGQLTMPPQLVSPPSSLKTLGWACCLLSSGDWWSSPHCQSTLLVPFRFGGLGEFATSLVSPPAVNVPFNASAWVPVIYCFHKGAYHTTGWPSCQFYFLNEDSSLPGWFIFIKIFPFIANSCLLTGSFQHIIYQCLFIYHFVLGRNSETTPGSKNMIRDHLMYGI